MGTRRADEVDLWALAEASSLYQTWGGAQVADRPPLSRAAAAVTPTSAVAAAVAAVEAWWLRL